MLAWTAALVFAFGAFFNAEGIAGSSTLLSWPVLACTGMVLLAIDQAVRRREPKPGRNGEEGDGRP